MELAKPLKCKQCGKEAELINDRCQPCREALIKERLDGLPQAMARYVPSKFIKKVDIKPELLDYAFGTRGLYLHGNSGTGKTQTAISIFMEWCASHVKRGGGYSFGDMWAFLNYPKFIMQLQASFKKNSDETAEELLDHYASVPCLIVDDMGAEKPTEFVRQSTYYLINEREMYERKTIITSNFSLDHLNDHIDSRIASRIAGMCDVVEMKGIDRRLKRSDKTA